MVEILESILAFSLKGNLVYSHQSLAEEWLFFCVFFQKITLSSNCNIFLSDGDFRKYLSFYLKQDLVHFHQPLADEWFFFVFLIKVKKVFAA